MLFGGLKNYIRKEFALIYFGLSSFQATAYLKSLQLLEPNFPHQASQCRTHLVRPHPLSRHAFRATPAVPLQISTTTTRCCFAVLCSAVVLVG